MSKSKSKRNLRILYLEDNLCDRELVAKGLTSDGLICEIVFAETKKEFQAALEESNFDLILSDVTLPSFSGGEALALAKEARPEVPFLFFSGTVGEEKAVAYLKAGAADYVLKQRLDRLAGAIRRAVRETSQILERKVAELRLAALAQRMHLLLESSGEGIYGTDLRGRCTFLNRAGARLTGWTAEEALGRNMHELLRHHQHDGSPYHEEDCPIFRASKTGEHCRLDTEVFWRRDATSFPVEYSCHPILEAGASTGAVVTFTDITERKRAEEALRESEQRFRQVTESIEEVFWLTDVAKNQMIYISPAYQKIWGRTPESLYSSAHSWLDAIHVEDRHRVRNAALTLQVSGAYDVIYRIIRPDGRERWIHDRAFPIKDADGNVYRLAGVAEDITLHRQLEDQFRQAQKMEAIGQLAGGIAHDFNNILEAIIGFTDLARTEDADNPGIAECLENIALASGRARDLVKQVLLFSRQHEQERKPMHLKRIVQEVLKLLRASVPSTIELQMQFADVPIVLADASSVHRVIMNLATNAWHAMKGKQGTLKVELGAMEVDVDFAATHPDLKPGRYVRLSMTDTGCGMNRATVERIFEPFFTTKPPGEGTGLGLSVVHGIMKSHDGGITVYSHPGEGTTFHLYFPAYESRAAEKETREAPVPRGQGQRILFVDDEPSLALLGKRILDRLGYSVTSKTDVPEALALFRDQSKQFDLVITDLTMPVMDGTFLAREMLQIRPGIPIILTTGYSGLLTTENARELGFRELLVKPSTARNLGEAVARVLREVEP